MCFIRRGNKRIPAIDLGNGLLRPVKAGASSVRVLAVREPDADAKAHADFAAMSFMQSISVAPVAEPPAVTYNRRSQQVIVFGGTTLHERLNHDEWYESPGKWCGCDRSWKRHRTAQYR